MAFGYYVDIASDVALNKSVQLIEDLGAACKKDGLNRVVDMLKRHQLIPSILYILDEETLNHKVQQGLFEALHKRIKDQVPNELLLEEQEKVLRQFSEENIPALTLKGVIFAERLWQGIEKRHQIDIDLLVRSTDFQRASHILEKAGYTLKLVHTHSQDWQRENIRIDLHWCWRQCPAYKIDESRIWSRTVEATVASHQLQTLNDTDTITFLCISLFLDLGIGIGKLKQFLDLWLLLRQIDENFDWQAFIAERSAENTLMPCSAVIAITCQLFDPSCHELPRLSKAFESNPQWQQTNSPKLAWNLLAHRRHYFPNKLWFFRNFPGSRSDRIWIWEHQFEGKEFFRSWRSPISVVRKFRLAWAVLFGRIPKP